MLELTRVSVVKVRRIKPSKRHIIIDQAFFSSDVPPTSSLQHMPASLGQQQILSSSLTVVKKKKKNTSFKLEPCSVCTPTHTKKVFAQSLTGRSADKGRTGGIVTLVRNFRFKEMVAVAYRFGLCCFDFLPTTLMKRETATTA